VSDSNDHGRRRVLPDANMHVEPVRLLPEHDVATVASQGCKGVRNGELLRRAVAAGFEVFISGDRRIPFQQTLSNHAIGVVFLVSWRLKLDFILRMLPQIREAVAAVGSGEIIYVQLPPEPQ
jgi:hypothetical protein